MACRYCGMGHDRKAEPMGERLNQPGRKVSGRNSARKAPRELMSQPGRGGRYSKVKRIGQRLGQ